MDLSKVPAWSWMLFCLICLVGTLLWAAWESRRRQDTMTRLGLLLQLSPASDRTAFALQDGISGLLFTENTFSVVDLRGGGSVVQRIKLDQVAVLKIYETTKDLIPFRLVTRRQSETRRIEIPSIVSFNNLVSLITACGARIEYVPEEA